MNDLDKPVIVTLSESALSYTLHDCLWIPCSAKFVTVGAATDASGVIQIHEIEEGKIVLHKQIIAETAIKCGTFSASSVRNRHLATGDFCGNLNVWDLEHSKLPIYSVEAHEKIISSIDGIAGDSVGCGAPELVTGSHDGRIKVWDPRQKKKAVAEMWPSDDNFRACWAVAFGNSYNSQERVVCSGFDNGDIKMFDLRAMKVRWETTVDNGVCSIEFDRKNREINKFVAVGLDGMVCLFETRNRDDSFSKIEHPAHNSTIWRIKHLPQNRDVFITCGGSGSLCLWKYTNYWSNGDDDPRESLYQMQQISVAIQAINSFDWCPDKNGLAICGSFDQTVRLLYISKLNQL